MSDYNPHQELPPCMIPDGGECCESHSELIRKWNEQRRTISELEVTVRVLARLVKGAA